MTPTLNPASPLSLGVQKQLIAQYEANVRHYRKLAWYFRLLAWCPISNAVRIEKVDFDREHARMCDIMREQGLLV